MEPKRPRPLQPLTMSPNFKIFTWFHHADAKLHFVHLLPELKLPCKIRIGRRVLSCLSAQADSSLLPRPIWCVLAKLGQSRLCLRVAFIERGVEPFGYYRQFMLGSLPLFGWKVSLNRKRENRLR